MSRPVDPEFVRRVPLVRRLLVGLAALAAVEAALLIVQISTLSAVIVHLFSAHRSLTSLTSDLLLLAAAGIGRSGVGGLREWVSRRSSTIIRGDLRMKASTALARLGSASSPGWVGGRSSGDLGSALGPGLDRADGYLTRALPALVSASVIPPILIGRLFLADLQSGVVVLVLLPLVPLFMALIGVTTRRHTQRQLAQLNHLSGRFLDLVQGLSTLRIYGRAYDQQRAVLASSERYRRTTVDVLKTALLSGLVLDLLTTLSIAVVAVDIGLRVDHGSLGLGVALLVLLLMPEIFAPVRNVGAQYHANLDGQAAIGTVLEVLAAADEASLPGEATLHARHTGRFTVHRVKVAHGDRSELSVDLDHLVVERGECVALTGRSGAGKSTLLAVLLGFTAPTSGTVLVDSSGGVQPQRGVDPDEWRAGIAWVPQHPRPTQPTVADEVRLGDPSASPDDVARALADCHAPAASTPLDEDGRNTSAGQRRRIALARALLRARAVAAHGNTPLVLLDEPSEDLDQATEQVVVRVISELAGWATIVMVTHSRTLVAIADRELRLADGRIESDQRVSQRHPIKTSPVDLGGSALITQPAADVLTTQSVGALVAAPQWHWRTLVRPARRGLAVAIAFSCLAGLAGLALMATSNWLILRAAQHPNVQALSIAVVGVRLFALTRPLARYAERMSGHDAALRLMSSLRSQVFDALIPLVPLRGAHLRRGELLRNFVADVDGVQDAIVRLVVPLAGAVATAAASVTVASLISPRAGLVLAIALALAFAAAILSSHRADVGSGSAVAAAAGVRDLQTIALVESLPELTAYGATAAALNDLAASEETVLRTARREAATAAVGSALTGTITAVGLVATLSAAGSAGLSGPAIGALLACALIGAEAVGAVPATVAAYGRLRGQLDRVMRLLATEPTRIDPAVPSAVPSGPIGMRGEGLTVAPQPSARFVLSDAVVTVRPGERTVVVGPSGSGKSTLLATLLGLLSATEGSLQITGDTESVALDNVTEQDLRPRVAGSLQGDHVFDVSLRDNLRFVRPSADDDALDDVARRAGLGDFIRSLPDGWATPAGPDGSALSGGQRQRLLLARALLADPDILILDEPTAHLDEETEAAVLADLTRATNGRTVVMSSHRPASLVGAGHVSRVAEGTVS